MILVKFFILMSLSKLVILVSVNNVFIWFMLSGVLVNYWGSSFYIVIYCFVVGVFFIFKFYVNDFFVVFMVL